MPEQQEMRVMVLEFALEQARKLCVTVEQSDLDFGRINEKFDVAGTEWHVTVRYWTDDETLKIEGHPHVEPDETLEGLPPMIAQLFGASQDSADGAFVFALPRAWLPEVKP